VTGVLVAVAVASGLDAVTPARPPAVPVVVSATDLPVGATLRTGDLRMVRLPKDVVPADTTSQPAALVGRTLSGAVRQGEPLTDERLIGAGLTADLPAGTVAAPVRLADADAAALLSPGGRVDVVGAPADGGAGSPAGVLLASNALVLALPTAPSRDADTDTAVEGDGALVLLATPRATAIALAAAATSDRLSVVLLPSS
jgi:Flp pilus assembly protein CpaB